MPCPSPPTHWTVTFIKMCFPKPCRDLARHLLCQSPELLWKNASWALATSSRNPQPQKQGWAGFLPQAAVPGSPVPGSSPDGDGGDRWSVLVPRLMAGQQGRGLWGKEGGEQWDTSQNEVCVLPANMDDSVLPTKQQEWVELAFLCAFCLFVSFLVTLRHEEYNPSLAAGSSVK